MATEPLSYQPIGGLNAEDAETDLAPTEVLDSSNFLYERKMAIQRPGLVSKVLTGIVEQARHGQIFDFGSAIYAVLNTGAHLYKIDTTLTATELTGGDTLAFGLGIYGSMAAVNGVVLVAGNPAGIVRWDPAGTTRTVLTPGANYRYVVGHLSRAVGAYVIGGSVPLLDPRQVGWSEQGDETNWSTGFSIGTTVLADSPDVITGLGNIRNILVIPGTSSFHMGYATGNANPAFTFQSQNTGGVGVVYPPTFAVDSEICYFAARDDIYTFNLVSTNPIGYRIRRELFAYLRAGINYRGFISRSIGQTSRVYYNLVPMTAGTRDLPHFVYDKLEDKWSRHRYAPTFVTAWYAIRDPNSAPLMVDQNVPPTAWYWDENTPCDQPAYFVSGLLAPGKPECDYKINRVLMRYKGFLGTSVVGVQGTVEANVDLTRESSRDTKSIISDNRWRRTWFNVELTGQDFQLRVDVPGGNRMATNLLVAYAAEAAEIKEGGINVV